jgi:pilus assembly protein CpaE
VPLVTVLGAKGGVGASLVATNLALALTRYGRTLLVDLHIGNGGDDLLLDLSPERSGADLLPVAGELTARHLELATETHSSGLSLLAGPASTPDTETDKRLIALLQALAGPFEWTVLDSPFSSPLLPSWLIPSDVIALVATADPPALRAAQRRLASFTAEGRARVGLVLNQFTRAHPAHPSSVAASLECTLLAVFPADPRSVGFQINFGRPCLLDPQSGFGRSAAAMARTMASKRSSGRAAA